MESLRFENLGYLHLLWVVLALALLVLAGSAWSRRVLERFASHNLVRRLVPDICRSRRSVRSLLLVLALVALVGGMTDPRWGRHYVELPRRGIDVVFVLDVSRSMLARDLAPNRLERAKQYITDVLEAAAGDRVGLVTFAGTPVLKVPLTINYNAFRLSLETVGTQSAPRGGSLIGDAIRRAADAFVDDIKGYKAIVLITDGEDHGSYPVQAARDAWEEKGIRVYTVGLGDATDGARVPAPDDSSRQYITYEGQEVWSKMDPQALREIAMAGNGTYIPAGTGHVDMGKVLYEDRIARQERRDYESRRVEQVHPRYQWFAAAALLLLCVEMLIGERHPRPAERTTHP